MSLSAGFLSDTPEIRDATEHVTLNLAGPSILKGKDGKGLPVPLASDAGKSVLVNSDGSGFCFGKAGGLKRERKIFDFSNSFIIDSFPAYGINFLASKTETVDSDERPVLPENCIILGVDLVVDDDCTVPVIPNAEFGFENVFIPASPRTFDDYGMDVLFVGSIFGIVNDMYINSKGYDHWQGFAVDYLTWTEEEE